MLTSTLIGVALLSAASWGAAEQEPAPRQDPIQVLATIPDLADMAREIGGEAVKVDLLIPPGADPHAILPKASHLVRLQRADVLLLMGIDYEHAFLPALLEKSRNPRIAHGSEGYVNIGRRIRPLEVPESLDRGAGADLHPRGNPHYNLDPERGRVMGIEVRNALMAADPGRGAAFEANWREWDRALVQKQQIWAEYLKPLRGKPLVSYHRSWSYFADRYGFDLIGELEPKPGLRPSPKHLASLASKMKESGAKVVLMEPWYPRSDVDKLLKLADARVVVACTTCGYTRGTATYCDWLSHLVDQIGQAYGQPPLAEFEKAWKTEPTGV